MISEIERNVIGHLLINQKLFDQINLKKSHFTVKANRVLFSVMSNFYQNGTDYDLVIISQYLEKNGLLNQAGGFQYITSSAQDRQLQSSFNSHVAELELSYKNRLLNRIALEITNEASSRSDYSSKITRIEQLLSKQESASNDYDGAFVEDLLPEYFNVLERRIDGLEKGLNTGFDDIDRHLNGLRDSDLIILAGRPAMGKTTLALNIAENIASHSKVHIFSLEMSSIQLLDKIAASVGGSRLGDIRNEPEETTLTKTVYALNSIKYNVIIDDSGGLDISTIRSRARRMRRKHDTKLIVIDYLQLINAKAESETVKIGDISRQLKELSKELNIPIIVLSQLNRSVESRSNKTPQMSDLRQSGQIEQDADIILMIYRDEVYNPGDNKGIASLFVRKFRHGETGQIDLSFNGAESKFSDYGGQPVDYNKQIRSGSVQGYE